MNSKFRLEALTDSNNSDVQLQAIYDLNQANTPEVGSLESMVDLKKLIGLSAYKLLALKHKTSGVYPPNSSTFFSLFTIILIIF